MKLLMIAWGYVPYSFSEGLCNAKLNYALDEKGIEVTTISRVDTGNTYDKSWTSPWDKLKENTILIDYPRGNFLTRSCDIIYSSIVMDVYNERGIRWARRVYQKALSLLKEEHFDAILTRSPNDISHIIGYKLKKKTGIKWIANWNDPADPIWPAEYSHNYPEKKQQKKIMETWKLLSFADINTFPSDTLRQHFLSNFPGLEGLRTEVIPHISLTESLWPKIKFKNNFSKIRLINSGNLSQERNPENLFIALNKLRNEGFLNIEFHIMGHFNDFVKSLIEKYNLKSIVKSIGSFGYLESVAKLQEYDILVLIEAKLEKGIFFASKITDYAQSGLPILAISPTNGFAKDMITKYKAGIVTDNLSIDSIYEGIKTLITDNNRIYNYNSSKLSEQFKSDNIVKKYISLIEDKE